MKRTWEGHSLASSSSSSSVSIPPSETIGFLGKTGRGKDQTAAMIQIGHSYDYFGSIVFNFSAVPRPHYIVKKKAFLMEDLLLLPTRGPFSRKIFSFGFAAAAAT